jgi:hypothetical protein
VDIGTIFVGIVLLVVAWACWTYLPHPIGILAGLIFGLIGLYFVLVGLVGPLDHVGNEHAGLVLPFLCVPKGLRRLL